MRSLMRWAPRSVLIMAACAGLGAAGCAAAHPMNGPATTARTASSHTPSERAAADAAAILKAFAVPPGARRLRRAPSGLRVPITRLVSTTMADRVSFWRAPGRPRAVLAWEQAHLPRRFTPGDQDFGPPSWDRTFSLAPVPGVLNTRDLVVEVRAAGNGQTAIRLDAQVSWQPPRRAAERLPSAARVVTITQLRGLDPHAGHPPAPVTIKDAAVVRRLAALVDGLQLSTIGPAASCPLGIGGGLRLTFLARVGSPPLAIAKGPATCGTVQFSVRGKRQPALQMTDSFIPQVLKVARVHWKVQRHSGPARSDAPPVPGRAGGVRPVRATPDGRPQHDPAARAVAAASRTGTLPMRGGHRRGRSLAHG